jgi:hypothetical protein
MRTQSDDLSAALAASEPASGVAASNVSENVACYPVQLGNCTEN